MVKEEDGRIIIDIWRWETETEGEVNKLICKEMRIEVDTEEEGEALEVEGKGRTDIIEERRGGWTKWRLLVIVMWTWLTFEQELKEEESTEEEDTIEEKKERGLTEGMEGR